MVSHPIGFAWRRVVQDRVTMVPKSRNARSLRTETPHITLGNTRETLAVGFYEDIAQALDTEGIESRVNDDMLFVPCLLYTSDAADE